MAGFQEGAANKIIFEIWRTIGLFDIILKLNQNDVM